jgi:3-hydroxybutyryl-CoA dehydrogenase
MEIRTVGVVGAGQMGGGIAQVAAQADLDVLLYDVAPKMFARALGGIEKSLMRLKDKEARQP